MIVVRQQPGPLVIAFAYLSFTLVSTATVGLMFWYYTRRPGDAETRLSALRVRVVAVGPTLIALAGLVVGAFCTLDGIVGVLD